MISDTQQEDDGPASLELLSFRIGGQEYSVDIMSVREIRGWTPATPLPHSAPSIQGVINLRGVILPIVDLSVRLGLEQAALNSRSVIIVAQIQGRPLGLLVDAVSDIISVPRSQLQPPPETHRDGGSAYVKSLTAIEGRLLRILELDALALATGELTS
jgi:purine-binding chemotaxis protein CheW